MLAKMIYSEIDINVGGAFVEGLVKLVDVTIAACALEEYFHVPGRLLSLIIATFSLLLFFSFLYRSILTELAFNIFS